MKEIILIEVVSIISYLYSLFMLIIPFTTVEKMVVLFLWTTFVAIFYSCLYKKHKLLNLSILLLFVPILYFREMRATIFISSTSLILFLYIRKSLFKGNYYDYIGKIKNSYLLYIPLIFIRSIIFDFTIQIRESMPFIIIYIYSSIILLRTIRHLDTDMGVKIIRINNIKNVLTLSLIFPILFYQNIKDTIRTSIDGALNIIFYPMMLLGTLLGSLYKKVYGLGKQTEPLQIVEDVESQSLPPLEEIGELFIKESKDYTIIKNISMLLLLILIIYIVYRTLKKVDIYAKDEIDYIEEREYIKVNNKKKRIFKRDRYPTEPLEQIRYYYRKYLNKIIKNGVEIQKTDTSLEINEKANEVFEDNILRIREIYIDGRYSNSKIQEKDVKEMEELLKKL